MTVPIELRRRTPAEITAHCARRIAELLNHPDAERLTAEQRITLLSITVNLGAAAEGDQP